MRRRKHFKDTFQANRLVRLLFPLTRENYYTHGNILLKAHRAVYFPVPKAACSSIKKVCADLFDLSYDQGNMNDSVHDLDFPYARRGDLLAGKYDHYFRFAIVRNPWDRLYSCFCSKILSDPDMNAKGWTNGVHTGFYRCGSMFYAGMPFAEFVEAVFRIPDDRADEHFQSQWSLLSNARGTLLPAYIGRFESIEASWREVCDHLQIDIRLPRLMISQRSDYQEAFDKRLSRLVAERYARDIECFGYDFEG